MSYFVLALQRDGLFLIRFQRRGPGVQGAHVVLTDEVVARDIETGRGRVMVDNSSDMGQPAAGVNLFPDEADETQQRHRPLQTQLLALFGGGHHDRVQQQTPSSGSKL